MLGGMQLSPLGCRGKNGFIVQEQVEQERKVRTKVILRMP